MDASGDWLASWGERWQRLGARHLRTPVNQHPHANALELKSYVEKQGREQVGMPCLSHTSRVGPRCLELG